MARAVGLDIGTRVIKVVELNGSPKAFKVQRVITRPVPEVVDQIIDGEVPPDADALLSETIRDVFQEFKLPKDDVCASFDSGQTVSREIIVPFLEDDQIRKVVKFEAENHLHSHNIEDVIINWVKTGESRDGSRLTVFASPKPALQRLLDILHGAGIEPSSVDLDSTALFTAYQTVGVFEKHPNAIVIDIGARSTTLLLVVGAKPVVIRSFVLGSDQVGASLSKELQVSMEEGRRRAQLPEGAHPDDLLVSTADLTGPQHEADKSLEQIQGDAAAEMRQRFIQKLHREAMRSLASLQEDAAPEVILLSGGGSLLPHLAEDLQGKFGIPVERVALNEYVDWKDQGPDPEFTQVATAPAVGCGLRILGTNPFDVELLKDTFAPTNRFDVIKGALATFVTLLFVLLLALAYVASQRWRAEERRYRYTAAKAGQIFDEAESRYLVKVEGKKNKDEAKEVIGRWRRRLPDDDQRIDKYMIRLKQRYRDLERDLGMGDVEEVPSALKVWLEIYRALNRVQRADYGQWLRVLKVDIKERMATVRIEVNDQAALDKVRKQLENSPYFKERARNPGRIVELGQAKSEADRWQRDFEFRFKEEGR